jgi:hypothetical protein
MHPLVKVLPSEFRRIILKNSLLEILIKGSQPEGPMGLFPILVLFPSLNKRMLKKLSMMNSGLK